MDEARRIFISYAGPDRSWALWIGQQLRVDGYSVELDDWSWRAGTSFIRNMETALASADHVLALCSSAYFDRDSYSRDEREAAVRLAHSHDGFLIPVLIEKIELPALIATLSHISLMGLTEDQAREKLRNKMTSPRPPSLDTRPKWPGPSTIATSETGSEALDTKPSAEFPGSSLPPVWNVPPRNRNFTNRDATITNVRRQLERSRSAVAITALHGLGGIGKTQLAIEYAWRYAKHYTAVWWISAEQEMLIPEQLAELAPLLGVPTTGDSSSDAARVLKNLQGGSGWLLIFDNAASPSTLRPWLSAVTGHVLITSRAHDWGAISSRVELDVLPCDKAIEFLRRRIPHIHRKDASAITQELGFLPLALEQAAAYIEHTCMDPNSFLEQFRRAREEFINRGEDLFYGGTVNTAWSLALEELERSAPATGQLLKLISYCGFEWVPLALFSDHSNELTGPLGAAIGKDPASRLGFEEVVAAALLLSLIRRDDEKVIMHRVVQTVIRSRLSTEEAAATSRTVRALLVAHQPSLPPDDPESWPRWKELAPHVLTAPALATSPEMSRQDAQVRALMLNLGWYLWSRGDAATAQKSTLSIYEDWKENLGEHHPDTLSAGHLLAAEFYDIGEHVAARELDEQVLAGRRETLGVDHPDTLASASNLARDLRGLADYAASRKLNEDTLERRSRTLGENHPDTLTSASSLARALAGSGNFEAARVLDEQTLERRKTTLGDRHPHTLGSANNLVNDLYFLRQFEAAKRLGEKNFVGFREVLGVDHPDTLNAASNLAGVLAGLEQFESARVLDEDTLARCVQVLGEDHPNTLHAKTNLATDLAGLGDHAAASLLGRDILARYREVLGNDHLDTLMAANNLAIDLRHIGEDEEAAQLEEEVREARGQKRDSSALGPFVQRERGWWWTRGR